MKKKHSADAGIKIAVLVICLIICGLFVWGIISTVSKLTHYGENTAIGQDQTEQQENSQPEKEQSTAAMDDLLPRNSYEYNCFYEENGLKRFESDTVVGLAGVDVSSYQGDIDWQAVKDAGVEFAMIRLGYRGYVSGELDMDDCFQANMEGAAAVGIPVGVYFFSQALNEEEAVEEAQYVLEHLDGYQLQYPVIFDWEEISADARTDEMNMVLLTSCAKAFCETVEEAGYTAGVYFNQEYGYMQMNLQSLKDYYFWLAEYRETPSFYYDFQMWQYTNEGIVPGIPEKVDLNIAFVSK